jgi:ribosomal protein L20A (L18A)
MKKSYEVEVRRTSFITIWVEAENEEQAETLAFEKIATEQYHDRASWDIESIEEVVTKGE